MVMNNLSKRHWKLEQSTKFMKFSCTSTNTKGTGLAGYIINKGSVDASRMDGWLKTTARPSSSSAPPRLHSLLTTLWSGSKSSSILTVDSLPINLLLSFCCIPPFTRFEIAAGAKLQFISTSWRRYAELIAGLEWSPWRSQLARSRKGRGFLNGTQ